MSEHALSTISNEANQSHDSMAFLEALALAHPTGEQAMTARRVTERPRLRQQGTMGLLDALKITPPSSPTPVADPPKGRERGVLSFQDALKMSPPVSPEAASSLPTATRAGKRSNVLVKIKKHSSKFIDSLKRGEVADEDDPSTETVGEMGQPGQEPETTRQSVYSHDLDQLIRALNQAQGVGRRGFDSQDETVVGEVENEIGRYRCDIHATSSQDYIDAEQECKQLVIEAGGRILEEHEYVGGFLYTLPTTPPTENPLESGDETLLGGYIDITPCTPLNAPHSDASRMNPTSVIAERANAESPKTKMRKWLLTQREKHETQVREEEMAQAGLKREEDPEEVVLSGRILDVGVELAIMQPSLLG